MTESSAMRPHLLQVSAPPLSTLRTTLLVQYPVEEPKQRTRESTGQGRLGEVVGQDEGTISKEYRVRKTRLQTGASNANSEDESLLHRAGSGVWGWGAGCQ